VTQEYIDILTQAFEFAEKKKDILKIIKTIMPNHLYWIFKLTEKKNAPISIYQNFTKYTAKMSIKQFNKDRCIMPQTVNIFDKFSSNVKPASSLRLF